MAEATGPGVALLTVALLAPSVACSGRGVADVRDDRPVQLQMRDHHTLSTRIGRAVLVNDFKTVGGAGNGTAPHSGAAPTAHGTTPDEGAR